LFVCFLFWWSKKEHVLTHNKMQTIKITVWIANSGHGLMGLIFFDQNVNSECYVSTMCNSFVLWLNATGLLLNTWWFVQDGATPHTANTVLDMTHSVQAWYPIDIKGRGHKWPPNSPDINPCDFFLWGYLMEHLFPKIPASIIELMALLAQMYDEITQNMCC
jgi:inhibitor of nuclear factor kappa-B kinase subunit alpha